MKKKIEDNRLKLPETDYTLIKYKGITNKDFQMKAAVLINRLLFEIFPSKDNYDIETRVRVIS